jgi:hypothetical protein
MKKFLSFLLLAVTASVLFTSCDGNKKGPYTLAMRLDKGDQFTQDITMNMVTSISMGGMNRDMKTDMEIGSDFEVLDSTAAGTHIKMTYTKMSMDMNMGMEEDTQSADSMIKKANQQMVGQSVVITLDSNKVVAVQQPMEKLPTVDSGTNKMLEKMFSKENLNSMYGLMFSMYPGKPVNVKDSWKVTNEIDLAGMVMKIDTKYTLVDVKDDLAEIDIEAIIDSKGNMNQEGMNFNMDMKGTQKGKFYIKVSDGYIQKGNYVMDIKTEMDIQGQKIPMAIKADYKVTGK